MRKLALVALATVFATSGLASDVAARANRGGPIWRTNDRQEAARAESRRDGNREARRDRKGDDKWRYRDRRHRPFFLFRRDRGEYCFVRKVEIRDDLGNVAVKRMRVCE